MEDFPFDCLKIKDYGWDITLTQNGIENFTVTYGKQVTNDLDYRMAAYELGSCIMHALACEFKLDNTTLDGRIIPMPKKSNLQLESIERLRSLLKPGDTVYTQIKHVSRSGMLLVIQLIIINDNTPSYIGWHAAHAMNLPYDRKREGIKISDCGTDMGFDLVYHLSYCLFGPMKDDKDDPGYFLKQRWL